MFSNRWIFLFTVCFGRFLLTKLTPLDDYVNKQDFHYKYKIIGNYSGPGYTNYVINMTSQKWKSADVVDRSVWWHYLTITIPDKITYNEEAILFIDGESNTDRIPLHGEKFIAITTLLGVSSQTIAVNVRMIPNQPIVYKADPWKRRRKEDSNIAWTWRDFMENSSDPEIILQLPMTKAVVKAMDTVSYFVKTLLGNPVNRFFVTGASKRGWITWLTCAVDKRVFAIAPIVMNLLNLQKSLHHHYRSLGGWTFAFKDYYQTYLTRDLDDVSFEKMQSIIDPLVYKDRFRKIKKLVISTTGDEFFLLDDSDYYYKSLQENTYLRIIPNAEHSCIGHIVSIMFSVRAFFLSTVTNTPIPRLRWTKYLNNKGGKIVLKTETVPYSVTVFYAKTLDSSRRDFRLFVASTRNSTKPSLHPVLWSKTRPTILGNNTFEANFESPSTGWLAFFIQATFNGVNSSVLELTTAAQIIPDTFPYPDCHGSDCFGELV